MSNRDSLLQSIANIIHMSADKFLSDYGINKNQLNGKMSCILFFFNYYRYCGNKYYERIAEDFLDDIFNFVCTSKIPAKFNGFNGLLGIAWGIEYLSQNKFVDADTDEVLKDIEKRIFGEEIEIPILLRNNISLYDLIHYNLIRYKTNPKPQIVERLNSIIDFAENLPSELMITDNICALIFLFSQYPNDKSYKILDKFHKRLETILNEEISINELLLIEELFNYINIPLNCKLNYTLDYEENIISDYAKYSFNRLLYQGAILGNNILTKKALSLIKDDEFWNDTLKQLNNNDSWNDFYLASLGIGLLLEEL